MKASTLALTSLAILALQSGCVDGSAGDLSDDEAVNVAEETLLSMNALSPNALSPNALAPNALAPNALAPNALAPNALSPNALASLKSDTLEGADARGLVRYAVSCALNSSQYFNFSWIDSAGVTHNERYTGLLGIAPGWATTPLTDAKSQALISACIAARVNYYGVTVVISVRSSEKPLKTLPSAQELTDYSHIEGAFWGNLFTQTPYLNACYNKATVTVSRNAQRDCAVGHLDNGQVVPCGMIQLQGLCSDLCDDLNGGQYYPACRDKPGVQNSPMTTTVVTTALP